MTERQELGSLEAMLFAHAEPVEAARLADALRLDTEETTELLQKLPKHLGLHRRYRLNLSKAKAAEALR